MLSAIGGLLPLAIAVAVSSVPIMVTILMLLSPKRNQVSVPFLIGWVVGLAGVVVAAALGAAAAMPARPSRKETAIGIGEIVIGVGVLVLAGFAWHRARKPVEGPNRWVESVERMGPVTAFGLAIALNLRPKGLLLGVAAGLSIAGSSLSGTERVIVVAVYVALSASTVLVPIIVTLAAPDRMQPRLVRARDWLTKNGGYITVVALGIIGILLIGAGLLRL